MNVKNWIPLVAAVLLGLIALVVARKALSKGGGEASTPKVGVVVATRDLVPGRELSAEDLAMLPASADNVPPQSFRTVQDVLNRTTIMPIFKGQVLMEPVLAPTGTRGGLAGLIPAGYRAMTVEVNEFSGLAGMIAPGSKVDVISILRDEKTGQPGARTILQNIEVRAVGRNINPAPVAEGQPQPPPSNNVTMLLTLKQAQTMQLATQNGRPWLVLRGNRTEKEVESELVTMADLRNEAARNTPGGDPNKTVPVAANDPFFQPTAPAVRVVQVIRGGAESTVQFQANTGERIIAQPAPAAPTTAPALAAPVTPAFPPPLAPTTKPAAEGRYMTGADPRPFP